MVYNWWEFGFSSYLLLVCYAHVYTCMYIGAVSDSYSKPLDRLTSPGTTLASPLFHSVVYTATQRMESGRTAEENITERDLEAVIKVYHIL